jgi:hypothetical protein
MRSLGEVTCSSNYNRLVHPRTCLLQFRAHDFEAYKSSNFGSRDIVVISCSSVGHGQLTSAGRSPFSRVGTCKFTY